MGIIIVFSTPAIFTPSIGIRIENEKKDMWEVKSISFNQYQTEGELLNPENNFEEDIYRSYQVTTTARSIIDENISICDYFLKNKWKINE